MDTSQKRIKMCGSAVELQDEWRSRINANEHNPIGDYYNVYKNKFSGPPEFNNFRLCHASEVTTFTKLPRTHTLISFNIENTIVRFQELIVRRTPLDDCIWLPRQDRLQEMIKKPEESAYGLTVRLLEFIDTQGFGKDRTASKDINFILNIVRAMSMEQLWLAFVMHEKFNKTWNGEDWE